MKQIENSKLNSKNIQDEINECFFIVEKTLLSVFKINEKNETEFTNFDQENFKDTFEKLDQISNKIFKANHYAHIF